MALAAYNRIVQDGKGDIQENATITITDKDTGLPSEVWADRDGTTSLGSSFTSSTGIIRFYANPGRYKVVATKGLFTATFDDELIGTSADGGIGKPKLDFDPVEYVANITELRALTGLVDGQRVSAAGSDGGGLLFKSGDQSAAVVADEVDPGEGNGGVVIAPSWDKTGVSGAWFREYGQAVNLSPRINPAWYRAVADDGATDVIKNMRAAAKKALSIGAGWELPATGSSYFAISDTLIIDGSLDILGPGEDTCEIRCTSTSGADAVRIGDTNACRGIKWRGFTISSDAAAGHCIDIGHNIVRCKIDVRLIPRNPDKSCVNGDFTTGTRGSYDTTWTGGEWRLTTSHNVPGFKIVANSTVFNTNTIAPRRIYYGLGAQFIWLECTSAGNWFLTNTIWKPECEVTNGGIIALFGCKDTEIYSPIVWDLSAANSGVMYNDGILLGSSGAGRSCRNTYIHGYQRTAGTLDSGVKDIHLQDADDTIFINCNNPSASPIYEIDMGLGRVTWIGNRQNITFTNVNNVSTTWVTHNLVETVRESVPISGAIATISAGSITAPSGFFRVETEGGAGTDDLDTIAAPTDTDGERITFRRSGVNTVVVKNGTGNLYTKTGADVTLDTVRKTITFQWDRLAAVWLEV